MSETLLSKLVYKFSQSPENLATESLQYILSTSPSAAAGLHRLVFQCGASINSDCVFRTQVAGSNGEIPDLIGFNRSSNAEQIILEAKFWASLTDNQPVTYLKRLPKNQPSILLFVAPATRIATLWPELTRRAILENIFSDQIQTTCASDECKVIRLDETPRVFALVSWRYLLTMMKSCCVEFSDSKSVQDIEQLTGLCERMDEKEFLPLRSDELGSGIARRFMQFESLLDDIAVRAVERCVAKWAHNKNRISQCCPIVIAEHNACIHFSPRLWASLGETPLWLGFYSFDWKKSVILDARIEILANQLNSRTDSKRDEGGNLWIPIYLACGEEKSVLVDQVVNQIERWNYSIQLSKST